MVEHQEKDNLEMVNLAPGLLGCLDTNQKVQGSLPLCAAEGMACPRGTSNPCLSPVHYYYKGFLYIKSKLNYHINGFPLAHSPPPNSPIQLQGGLVGLARPTISILGMWTLWSWVPCYKYFLRDPRKRIQQQPSKTIFVKFFQIIAAIPKELDFW